MTSTIGIEEVELGDLCGEWKRSDEPSGGRGFERKREKVDYGERRDRGGERERERESVAVERQRRS